MKYYCNYGFQYTLDAKGQQQQLPIPTEVSVCWGY